MHRSVWAGLAGLPKFKESVTVNWGQHAFNEKNKKAVFTKATLPTGARIGKRYARFAPSACIQCHAVDWQDWYVDTDLFSRERKSQFGRPKLIFAENAPRLRVAYDDQGLFLGHSLFSTAVRAPVTFLYLTGVLNSVVGNFTFAFANNLPDLQKPRRLVAAHLAEIPLLVPGDEDQRKLAGFVEGNSLRLIHAKQARRVVGDVWTHVANYHAQTYGTMSRLLTNRLPGQKTPWVRRLVPSLATLSRRSRKFRNVRLQGDRDGPVLRIYGYTDAGDEIVLAEAEFTDRDLMLYACLSASIAPRPRTKPTTVRQIMEEARVPLTNENVTDGARAVIAQLSAQAPKALTAESVPAVQTDLAKIDADIEELEALVDAEVLRLYGLTKERAGAVLKWTKATALERQRIETFLENLSRNADDAPVPDSPTPERTEETQRTQKSEN